MPTASITVTMPSAPKLTSAASQSVTIKEKTRAWFTDGSVHYVPDLLATEINSELCFTGVDNYPGYGFAFPAQNASAKTTIMDLQNALSTIMIFYSVLLLTNELILQPEKYNSVLCSWNLLIMISTILKHPF